MQNSTLPPFCIVGLSQTASLRDMANRLTALLSTWQQHPATQQKWGFSTSVYCIKQYADDGTCQLIIGRLSSLDAPLPHPDFAAHLIHPQHFNVEEIQQHQSHDIAACLQQTPAQPQNRQTDFVVIAQYGAAKYYRSTGLANINAMETP